MKEKFIAALKRAAWTAAEVALAMIPVNMGIDQWDWKNILSVVAGATIISLLKSVIISMPEVQLSQEIRVQAQKEPEPDPVDKFVE